jgi:hypothetical protein
MYKKFPCLNFAIRMYIKVRTCQKDLSRPRPARRSSIPVGTVGTYRDSRRPIQRLRGISPGRGIFLILALFDIINAL